MRQFTTLSFDVMRDASLLTGIEDGRDAVEAVVRAHGKLIADLRAARRRVDDLDKDAAETEDAEKRLVEMAREILERFG